MSRTSLTSLSALAAVAAVLSLSPTVASAGIFYSEDFESGAGGWTSIGTNNTWQLGTPANPVIIGASSGVNAWVTNLTGDHSNNENSAVVSPAINLSTLAAPSVQLDTWWESESSWDGAVLQSSIDSMSSWQTIGGVGTGTNWYTHNSISGNPGGQQLGWSGRLGSGSNGYLTAVHEITSLAGQSAVNFRVAFGSDGSVTDDGFAFDNFQITDPSIAGAPVAVPEPSSFLLGGLAMGVTGLWRKRRAGDTEPETA